MKITNKILDQICEKALKVAIAKSQFEKADYDHVNIDEEGLTVVFAVADDDGYYEKRFVDVELEDLEKTEEELIRDHIDIIQMQEELDIMYAENKDMIKSVKPEDAEKLIKELLLYRRLSSNYWVSVNDRLPECRKDDVWSEHVVVWAINASQEPIVVKGAMYNYMMNKWNGENGLSGNYDESTIATHWMNNEDYMKLKELISPVD